MQYFVVDVFTHELFRGNPAGVCLLSAWPAEGVLQSIAAENNLSETAFLVGRQDGEHDLRWFTPTAEIDLCGHATLASGYVLMSYVHPQREECFFHTRSGLLSVQRQQELWEVDLPARPPLPSPRPEWLEEALGCPVLETHQARDFLALVGSQREVAELSPDLHLLERFPGFGVIVTAKGDDCDFVSRFFAPAEGIDEDPVTGSAHCTLAPFWGERLGESVLRARQLSRRGGEILCRVEGDRVKLNGAAVCYLKGSLQL